MSTTKHDQEKKLKQTQTQLIRRQNNFIQQVQQQETYLMSTRNKTLENSKKTTNTHMT